MKTLVIVDVQNDFIPGGALAVPDGDRIVPVINALQGGFDLVVATQDWHPPNHVSFASNHQGKKPFGQIDLDGMRQTLWPDHCVQGTRGAEFHPELDLRPVEAIFRKGMDPGIDSYSGFFDNGHKKTTALAGYLREKEAADLYFCGLAAEICVAFTLKDALGLGFAATLIEDATRALDQEDFHKAKRDLVSKGARVVSSAEIG
ncbi:MAG: bifunctional nicotinamidase/pyrazinamidase [Candidatus Krumholzibacteriales bacterium]